MEYQLKITNTLSGKKEAFQPLNFPEVKLYVCGITPYDFAHIGHGRVYVTFDVLYRLLNFLGYKVKYCRNFTDIDDKLLNKAQVEFNDKFRYQEIADRYIKAYKEDMLSLNCMNPDYEPKVTETIDEIIEFIQGLIDKGVAYVVGNDVYYSVRKFDQYGKLSKRKLDDLKSGARVEIDQLKQDPLDFALWKSEDDNSFWQSPWGWGRPGWHIECSAMAAKFLGKHIDIHGGGMDLIFPHHENEIAQSEGLYGPIFAKYWMHNAFVRINKEKMSKSLGNFFTLKDVFQKFDPMVVRFYYLNHNYTIPIDFAFEELERAQKSYQKLAKIFDTMPNPFVPTERSEWRDTNNLENNKIIQQMLEFVTDDLNTAGMFGVLHQNLNLIEKDNILAGQVKAFLQNVIGLNLKPLAEKAVDITPEIQELLEQRELARKNKEFKKADQIRDQLVSMGVQLSDKAIK